MRSGSSRTLGRRDSDVSIMSSGSKSYGRRDSDASNISSDGRSLGRRDSGASSRRFSSRSREGSSYSPPRHQRRDSYSISGRPLVLDVNVDRSTVLERTDNSWTPSGGKVGKINDLFNSQSPISHNEIMDVINFHLELPERPDGSSQTSHGPPNR